jgi:uncharacterized protein YkwD
MRSLSPKQSGTLFALLPGPFSWVLLSLAFLVLCQPAAAQNVDARPVARLVTSATPLKPRRVTPTLDYSAPLTTKALLGSDEAANSIERRAFQKTNLARVQNGLSPLVWDADLYRMAREHSEKMAHDGYFSHVTPEGMRLRDRARAAGILQFSLLGENIAYNQGYEDPGAFAVEKWMSSPGHRANILSDELRASAIGTFVSADGSVFLTQIFITR